MYPHPTNTFGRPSTSNGGLSETEMRAIDLYNAPNLNPTHGPVPGTAVGAEMSDKGPRRAGPYLRLSDRDKALIRFLIANDCGPRDIQGHPKAGWSLDSIKKYKHERADNDGTFITQEFYDILKEIKAGGPTGVNAGQKNANPSGASNAGGNGPRTRASTNKMPGGQPVGTATSNANTHANATASGSGSNTDEATVPATDFLLTFLKNAGIDDHKSYAMLRAAGFTKAQKLYSIAELGKNEVDQFVKAAPELAGLSSVDKTLLVSAFIRLANQG
ncbi:hypothetical protein B0H11DRAFT_2435888 [Mycena galericulata]|nr:hypothetical protein B0H11DRAFT_2435888 [Mycena galericulata]